MHLLSQHPLLSSLSCSLSSQADTSYLKCTQMAEELGALQRVREAQGLPQLAVREAQERGAVHLVLSEGLAAARA